MRITMLERLQLPSREPGTPAAKIENENIARHRQACMAFDRYRVGATSDISSDELAVLSMVDGISTAVEAWEEQRDPFFGQALFQMLTGFDDLMNYPNGRLQGARLLQWSRDTLETVGVDPDTGQWVGGA